jgi:hypothetical protein
MLQLVAGSSETGAPPIEVDGSEVADVDLVAVMHALLIVTAQQAAQLELLECASAVSSEGPV